jgi:hypothetical protein
MAIECGITTVDGKKFKVNTNDPQYEGKCKEFFKNKGIKDDEFE